MGTLPLKHGDVTLVFAYRASDRPAGVRGMPRRARIVIPDCPHHVTQRGNRGEEVFFTDANVPMFS